LGGVLNGGAAGGAIQAGAFNGTDGKLHGVVLLLGGNLNWAGTTGIQISANAITSGALGHMYFEGANVTANTLTVGISFKSVANFDKGIVQTNASFGAVGGVINFNGGTLQARPNAANQTLLQGSAAGSVYVWNNGATFDSNGTTSSVTASLLSPYINGLNSLSISNPGANYTSSNVTVVISGGGGFGATATAVVNTTSKTVTAIYITNAGYGYTSMPTVTVTQGNTTTTAVISGATDSKTIDFNVLTSAPYNSYSTNSGYVAPPIVAIYPAYDPLSGARGPGQGASAYATMNSAGQVSSIVVANPGVGYASIATTNGTFYPTIMIQGGGGATWTQTIGTFATLSTGGGITQTGSGTITYSNSFNTFTGPVNLNGGVMILSGTFSGGGLVSLANNTTLRVSGRVNSPVTSGTNTTIAMLNGGSLGSTVALGAGGTLTANGTSYIFGAVTMAENTVLSMMGDGAATARLNLTDLNLQGTASTFKFDLDPVAKQSDRVVLTGGVNFGGTLTISVNQLSTLQPGDVYTVGTFTGAAPVVMIDPNTYLFGFNTVSAQTTATAITVAVGGLAQPANAYWTGQFGANWTATQMVLGSLYSQFNTDGNVNARQYPGPSSTIIFNSTTAPLSNLNVVLDVGTDVKGVRMDANMTSSVLISSTGSAALTLEGNGITNNATQPGVGLTIAAPVTVNANQTWSNSAGLTVLTVTGNVSSVAGKTLTLGGGGQILLSGTNSGVHGTIAVGLGTVTAGSTTALGATDSTLTFLTGGGTLDLNGQGLTIGNLSGGDANAIITNSNVAATLAVNETGVTTYSGLLNNGTNSLALRLQGGGTLTLLGGGSLTGDVTVRNGRLQVDGGTLGTAAAFPYSVGASYRLMIGDTAGQTGVVSVSNGGWMSVRNVYESMIMGNAGGANAVLYVNSGGSVTMGQQAFISNADGAYAAIVVNGGLFSTNDFFNIGNNGRAVLNVKAGVFQMTNAGTQAVQLGNAGGNGRGLANFEGGTVTSYVFNVGNGAPGVLNVLGNANFQVRANAEGGSTASGASSIVIANAIGGAGSVLNLNGGRTYTSRIQGANATVSSFLNLNGGTLIANNGGNAGTFINNNIGKVTIWGNNAIIDDNGYNLTIPANLLSPQRGPAQAVEHVA